MVLLALLAELGRVWDAANSAPLWPGAPPDGGNYVMVANLHCHSCALDVDGAISCWGDGDPQSYVPAEAFVQVTAGYGHACGITADREHIRCWGRPSTSGG
ncbi:MAG: RCC1 domain-containing protein [Pseudomonadota bacterium]|nr:RCC1 domain-containing protein [Pseudomonadota bacterium]